jgi:hypothetical protein
MVLGCGGTQIENGQDVVWNDGTALSARHGNGGWATGGGVSTMFDLPPYQQDLTPGPVSIVTNKKGRGVPDIAMSATNYFLRVQGTEMASGGTSAVAPLMASLVALLNQAKRKNVGFLNPFLYANASRGAVKDVTDGTNAITDTTKGYKAGKGWDACSGLGSPDGTAILKLLSPPPRGPGVAAGPRPRFHAVIACAFHIGLVTDPLWMKNAPTPPRRKPGSVSAAPCSWIPAFAGITSNHFLLQAQRGDGRHGRSNGSEAWWRRTSGLRIGTGGT